MQQPLRALTICTMLAATALLAGCGSTLTRLPDGSYERESRSTIEQRAADALRRDGASTEAKETQRRADKTLEQERKSPWSTFIADLLYSIFDLARDNKSAPRGSVP